MHWDHLDRPRPSVQADALKGESVYPENSVSRMVEHLGAVPEADISKLTTVTSSTDLISPTDVPESDVAFIDAEHTYECALRDARFCREAGCRVIAFHDWRRVKPAIKEFMEESEDPGFQGLRERIAVVELGPPTVIPLLRSAPSAAAH